MDAAGSESVSGVQVTPRFADFHRPPVAAPTYTMSGSASTASMAPTRPLIPVGPMLRASMRFKKVESSCAAAGAAIRAVRAVASNRAVVRDMRPPGDLRVTWVICGLKTTAAYRSPQGRGLGMGGWVPAGAQCGGRCTPGRPGPTEAPHPAPRLSVAPSPPVLTLPLGPTGVLIAISAHDFAGTALASPRVRGEHRLLLQVFRL